MKLIRVLRTSRRPLRVGGQSVSNAGNGTVLDLDNVATRRDFQQLRNELVVVGEGFDSAVNTIPVREANTDQATLVTAKTRFTKVELPRGAKVTSATFVSGATPAGTPTNQWASLWQLNTAGTVLTCVAVSADALTAAWIASAAKTFTYATAYTVNTPGDYYVGLTVVATTVPTLYGLASPPALQTLLPGKIAVKSANEATATRSTPVATGTTVNVSDLTGLTGVIPFARLA